MLWVKGWLETRYRFVVSIAITVFLLAMQYWARNTVPTAHAKTVALDLLMFSNGVPLITICGMLAGAGIMTQASFQATKGIHGSTLFTLSLPVSRLRLLAVRAVIGWLEAVVAIVMLCWGTWLFSPVMRAIANPAEMAEYAAVLIACASPFYFLSVLLATFLDDQWRTWGTMIAAGAIAWLSHAAWLPASLDIVQAIGKRSPIAVHTMPWAAMFFAITLASTFFFAALKIVRIREY